MWNKTKVNKQAAIDYIAAYWKEHDLAPRIKDVAKHLTGSEANAGNVSRIIIAPLIDEGFLLMERYQARSLRLTPKAKKQRYSEVVK